MKDISKSPELVIFCIIIIIQAEPKGLPQHNKPAAAVIVIAQRPPRLLFVLTKQPGV